jgi:small-conductance mechanosensitive channel
MDIDRMKRARPALVRSAIASLIALAALIVATSADPPLARGANKGELTTSELICLAGVIVMLVTGVAAVRALVNAIKAATADASGVARGTPVSFLVAVIGYGILLLSALTALGVNVGGLLLGGAFTGVVIGIAAQQTLGNFFAGIVLILMRPFSVGESVFLKGGPIGGEYEGIVTEMSLFYVHLITDRGPVQLPNAGVLAAAIGPGARTEDKSESDGEAEEAREPDPGPEHGGTPAT